MSPTIVDQNSGIPAENPRDASDDVQFIRIALVLRETTTQRDRQEVALGVGWNRFQRVVVAHPC